MTYAEKKALGLILSAADKVEANAIAAEIKQHGGSAERWDRADRTPAISAEVHNLVSDSASCHVTATEQLEQFYRFGESGLSRGGKVWKRPLKLSTAARALLGELKRHDVDYARVGERVYVELREAGLARVHFSSTGNRVFATSAGKVA